MGSDPQLYPHVDCENTKIACCDVKRSRSDGITYLSLSVKMQITIGETNEEIAHTQMKGVRVCKEMATSINN
jgi:hypothetical protein